MALSLPSSFLCLPVDVYILLIYYKYNIAYAVDLYGEEMAGCLEDHSEQQYIHFEKDNESSYMAW
ncbi:hypothetical protein C1645_821718 [Glomus cerebriforme]|uniref:Uncharacterized protein n=1 Tax=Glomus cerebriforme TaxID=658196 RepID=A0A397SZQ8_9GLOM|nr:hypothetical protein C1645_821718 [Glomus cerebriforme]